MTRTLKNPALKYDKVRCIYSIVGQCFMNAKNRQEEKKKGKEKKMKYRIVDNRFLLFITNSSRQLSLLYTFF